MDLRIFTEPQQGATYDDLLAVALEAERLGFGAFFRSDHYLGMGTDGLPGPSDAWVTLAGLARDTTHDPARHDDDQRDVPAPRPAGDQRRQRRPDERRPGRAGHRRRVVRGRARGVRHPVPGDRRSGSTGSRSSSRSSPGCGRPRAGSPTTASTTRSPTAPGLPKPAQAKPPVLIGGKGHAAHPRAGRAVRRRVQPAVRATRTVTEAQFARVREACERRDRDPGELIYSNALDRVRRRGRGGGRPAGPRRSAGSPTTCGRTLWRGRPTRCWTRSAGTPPWAASGSTCRCSTWHDLDHLRLMAADVLPHALAIA